MRSRRLVTIIVFLILVFTVGRNGAAIAVPSICCVTTYRADIGALEPTDLKKAYPITKGQASVTMAPSSGSGRGYNVLVQFGALRYRVYYDTNGHEIGYLLGASSPRIDATLTQTKKLATGEQISVYSFAPSGQKVIVTTNAPVRSSDGAQLVVGNLKPYASSAARVDFQETIRGNDVTDAQFTALAGEDGRGGRLTLGLMRSHGKNTFDFPVLFLSCFTSAQFISASGSNSPSSPSACF